jgi:RNA polymerase sigma-70 factor (ECF subfamily)
MIDEPFETVSLIQRLHGGSQDALAALFECYRPRLRRMVRLRMDARLSARVDASDVVQEAYLDAARQVESYLHQPRVAFYVWLRGLTWERLLNIQRQHLGARCRAVGRELPLPVKSSVRLAQALLVPGSSPSQALLKKELRHRLRRAIGKLGPEDQEVILMRHYEDMSNGEVAQALGLSASAATMRYGRALFRLKEVLLANLGPEESRP